MNIEHIKELFTSETVRIPLLFIILPAFASVFLIEWLFTTWLGGFFLIQLLIVIITTVGALFLYFSLAGEQKLSSLIVPIISIILLVMGISKYIAIPLLIIPFLKDIAEQWTFLRDYEKTAEEDAAKSKIKNDFIDALRSDDIQKVEKALINGIEHINLPLRYSDGTWDYEEEKYLDSNQEVVYEVSSVVYAFENNLSPEILNLLCEKGADTNQINLDTIGKHLSKQNFEVLNKYNSELLPLAFKVNLYNANPESFNNIKVLLECGFELKGDGPKYLKEAILSNNIQAVKLFLEKKVSLNDISLLEVIENGYRELAELLLKNGVKFNAGILHKLISKDLSIEQDTLNLLIQYGLDINNKDKNTHTVLNKAVESNNFGVAKILLNSGADLNDITLHKCVKENNLEMLDLLTRYNVNVDTLDKNKNTALQVAVSYNLTQMAEVLLLNNASVDGISLLPAAKSNNTSLIKSLIKYDVNVNTKTTDGFSALTYAIQHQNLELINLLIAKNVDIDGVLIHTLAFENNNKAVKVLLIAGVDINRLNKESQSLLSIAISNKNMDLVNILLQRDAYINEKALTNAIKDENTVLIQQLVDHGADVTNEHYFEALIKDRLDIFNIIYKISLLKSSVKQLNLFEENNQAKLTLCSVEAFSLGIKLTYEINNDALFDKVLKSQDDVKIALSVRQISLYEDKNQNIVVEVFNNSKEAKLVSQLTIKNQSVRFYDSKEINSLDCLFFYPVSGSSLEDWNNEKANIESMLEQSIIIENFDSTHQMYNSYSKEHQSPSSIPRKLIVITESLFGAIPDKFNLSGEFLKFNLDEKTKKMEYIFTDIEDSKKWEDKKKELEMYLNMHLDLIYDEASKHLTLKQTTAEVLPSIINIKSKNNQYPKLKDVIIEDNNTYYYYENRNDITFENWKIQVQENNLKNIFDQQNHVYKLNETVKDGINYIVIEELDKIPLSSSEFVNPKEFLKEDTIFWGYGSGSKKYYTNINDTTHMMNIGKTGSGKSTLMQGVILSLLNNMNSLGKLYLIDLKDGVEFNKYKEINSDKITVFDESSTPQALLDTLLEIEAEMALRNAYINTISQSHITTDPVYLIIDEYAAIANMPESSPNHYEVLSEIRKTLQSIASRSRSANIKLIIQTQNATEIEDKLKNNLNSRILMQTNDKSNNEFVLSDTKICAELGIDNTKFSKGRFLFQDNSLDPMEYNELQYPRLREDEYKKYIDVVIENTSDLEKNLLKHIDKVRNSKKHLQHTKRLAGTKNEEVTKIDSSLDIAKENEENSSSSIDTSAFDDLFDDAKYDEDK